MPDNGELNGISTRRPLRVCLLGAEGAGKTCFMAGLALLSEPDRETKLGVTHFDHETAAYLDDLRATLRGRRWPPATTKTMLLTLRVAIDGRVLDLKLVDYAGENFREALRRLETERIEELYDHYRRADAILLLFDPHRDLAPTEDESEQDQRIERQLAHLQAVTDIWLERTGGGDEGGRKVDVGIILTKADTVPGMTGVGQAKRHFWAQAPRLDQKIRDQAHAVRYFPLSAVGAAETVPASSGADEAIPARDLQPRGYEEIFEWILKRKRAKERMDVMRSRPVKLAAIVLALLLSFGALWNVHQQFENDTALAVFSDPHLSVVEKLQQSAKANSAEVRALRTKLCEGELADLRGRFQTSRTLEALDDIRGRLQSLEPWVPAGTRDQFHDLMAQIDHRTETLRLEQVKQAFGEDATDFPERALAFLHDFPDSRHRSDVESWQRQHRFRRMEAALTTVRNLRVTNAVTLAQKSAALVEFLQQHGQLIEDEGKRQRMRRAAELAKKFSEPNHYKVRLKSFGGLSTPRQQRVQLFIGAGPSSLRTFPSSGATRDVNWPQEDPLTLQWQAGRPIRIVLEVKHGLIGGGLQLAATCRDETPTALRLLQGRQALSQITPGWEAICQRAFVQFEVEGISTDDWQCLTDFILPGEKL